jgi:hypothetical protein
MAARTHRDNRELNVSTRTGAPTEDERLLESVRPAIDFTHSDPWRVFRIMGEFVEGFDTLANTGRAVSVFGSARVPPDHEQYHQAEETARLLAEAGFAVITGGGPGIMEAANKGAREAGGSPSGATSSSPSSRAQTPIVEVSINFRYSSCGRPCS